MVAPSVAAEGLGEFGLREVDGLRHSLGEVGEGAGDAGIDESLGDGGEEAAQGCVEVTGGEIFAGEEEGDVTAEVFGGEGLGFFAGVEVAEVRVVNGARSTAAAAIGEGEGTEECASVGANRHGSLQKSWI